MTVLTAVSLVCIVILFLRNKNSQWFYFITWLCIILTLLLAGFFTWKVYKVAKKDKRLVGKTFKPIQKENCIVEEHWHALITQFLKLISNQGIVKET